MVAEKITDGQKLAVSCWLDIVSGLDQKTVTKRGLFPRYLGKRYINSADQNQTNRKKVLLH